MARFTEGQKVEYKTWDGSWETGTISEGPNQYGDYIIDVTVYDYDPRFVTRTTGTIREAH